MTESVGAIVSSENPPAVVDPTSAKPPIVFEVNEFEDGDWKGFKFTTPEFTSLDAATTTYGVEKVLSLLNTQVNARIRTKVKNGLPKGLKPSDLTIKQTELASKNGGLLFSQDEAAAWRPEVRELSPNQLFKKAKEAFANAQKESDPAKKMVLMQEGSNFLVEAGKALAA